MTVKAIRGLVGEIAGEAGTSRRKKWARIPGRAIASGQVPLLNPSTTKVKDLCGLERNLVSVVSTGLTEGLLAFAKLVK